MFSLSYLIINVIIVIDVMIIIWSLSSLWLINSIILIFMTIIIVFIIIIIIIVVIIYYNYYYYYYYCYYYWFPGLRAEYLTKDLVAISPDTVVVVDSVDCKVIHILDAGTGKEMNKVTHSADVLW